MHVGEEPTRVARLWVQILPNYLDSAIVETKNTLHDVEDQGYERQCLPVALNGCRERWVCNYVDARTRYRESKNRLIGAGQPKRIANVVSSQLGSPTSIFVSRAPLLCAFSPCLALFILPSTRLFACIRTGARGLERASYYIPKTFYIPPPLPSRCPMYGIHGGRTVGSLG